MATNPLIPQGTINRLLATVLVASYSSLNVAPGNLTKRGISIDWEGQAAAYLPTMTGAVPSGEPYQVARVTIPLVRSQALASYWESQRLSTALIGAVTITPDTVTLPQYSLSNCVIQNVSALEFAGEDPAMVVTVMGTYYINAGLFS